jgi:hypothetical protein
MTVLIDVRLVLWELICMALFYSVFYRTAVTDKTTRLDIRLALWLCGMSALGGMAAPLYDWYPKWPTLLITGSVVVLQIVTARYWHKGVPYNFIHPLHQPRRRAEDKT